MIREWLEPDLPVIMELLEELNKSLDEDQELSIGTIREHYFSMIKMPNIYKSLVYEEDGKIHGFISMIFYQSIYHKVGTALINELVVSNEKRNMKIGRQLLEYGIELAKKMNMDEIEIGVMKENKQAIRFYKRNGITEEYLLLGKEF